MSGGRSTVGLKRGEALPRQAGDITSVSPEGHALTDHFFLELKHYKTLGIRSFFINGTGTMAVHWAQTRMQAIGYGKIPLLIAKQNNVPALFVSPRGMAHILIGKEPHSEIIRCTTTKVDQQWCEVCLFDDLLSKEFKYKQRSNRVRISK